MQIKKCSFYLPDIDETFQALFLHVFCFIMILKSRLNLTRPFVNFFVKKVSIQSEKSSFYLILKKLYIINLCMVTFFPYFWPKFFVTRKNLTPRYFIYVQFAKVFQTCLKITFLLAPHCILRSIFIKRTYCSKICDLVWY